MHAFSLYFQLLYIKKIIQDCNIIYKISTIQILTHLLKEYRSKELYDTFDNEIDERKKQ